MRIISVFFIILNHYSLYGGFKFENPLTVNAMTVQFLHLGGKIGVDMFIFISGWFMSTSKTFNLKRIVQLCMQVLFYSIILAAAGIFLKTLSPKDTIRMLAAIPFGNWIFITSYFMLFCLSPILNIIINNISKQRYFILLVFLGITWCIFPTFFKADFDMSNTSWYIYIYLVAGFLRKYESGIPQKPKIWIMVGVGSLLLIMFSEVILEIMGVYVAPIFGHHAEHFRSMNSVLVLITVVCTFIGVSQLNPRISNIIPKIASTSLAVFVLHDNGALRPLLWTEIFKTTSFAGSPFLILHALITASVIFAVGCLIDLLRQITIEKWTLKVFFPLVDKAEKKFYDLLDRILG